MAGKKPELTVTLEALRDLAMRYPEADEGTSCSNVAIRAKKKAYLYLGSKADSIKVMLKVTDSKPEVEKLAKREPDHYSVNEHGWVTIRFEGDEAPPEGLLEGWLDESYRALAPKKLVASLPEKGPPVQ